MAASARSSARPALIMSLHRRVRLRLHTAMPYHWGMLFIETSTFSKLLPKYLTDDEYRALQSLLMQRPEAGAVIKGSGGVRKVRWAPSGSGKSGGVRVIYYWKKSDDEVWMLTLYQKSERSTILGHALRQIAEAIKDE
ncbi:type II toxin-antitoxin system RelE/ParE family toxin [Halorhodospira abdelmalekii]|uniref:type II toxin-antitoxin system RelE/ParE family toxin n=1 Tax=Halorhodospira abdelmalekii TaxID=421629 RepID=UPI001F5BAFF1|nr:type II toxin-antitoxin system RelE/ParE family toxin [Halorhodospira abdelmalekii]